MTVDESAKKKSVPLQDGQTIDGERIVPMRLQKFLARAGVASRRGSENLMTAGRVKVNGVVTKELGSKVDPLVDEVMVDDKLVELSQGSVTLMLHKPAGYITTMSDPYNRPCVADLVPVSDYPGLFPIGRLDFDTTGILLFSTDGELGNGLLHPRHHVDKTYFAHVDGIVKDEELNRLRDGVKLDDGMTLPAEVSLLGRSKGESDIRITIHEGRKRQVRRMLDYVGHPVLTLHRSQFGPLVLGDLPEGSWRLLTEEEMNVLRNASCR